ncbi:MAG: DNA-3-methyladenine glycosylase 2 family protein [Planctomycetota bacterium]
MSLPDSRYSPLDDQSIRRAAKRLADSDRLLAAVLERLGPPPLWKRPARFSTFVRIILEQQVSLASAKSTYDQLKRQAGTVTAKRVTKLGEAGLRELGFSRQKARYTFALAEDVRNRRFSIRGLANLSSSDAHRQITSRLGLGDWSADVYLMMALGHPDILPVGDLALIKGVHELDPQVQPNAPDVSERAEVWRPYRSVATRMVWQAYLDRRGKVFVQ